MNLKELKQLNIGDRVSWSDSQNYPYDKGIVEETTEEFVGIKWAHGFTRLKFLSLPDIRGLRKRTIKCKHCTNIPIEPAKECSACWELRTRIERNPKLTLKFLMSYLDERWDKK